MAEPTVTFELSCSLADAPSSGETVGTSQETFASILAKRNTVANYNTGRFNADTIVSVDESMFYNLQLIYNLNEPNLIIESAV